MRTSFANCDHARALFINLKIRRTSICLRVHVTLSAISLFFIHLFFKSTRLKPSHWKYFKDRLVTYLKKGACCVDTMVDAPYCCHMRCMVVYVHIYCMHRRPLMHRSFMSSSARLPVHEWKSQWGLKHAWHLTFQLKVQCHKSWFIPRASSPYTYGIWTKKHLSQNHRKRRLIPTKSSLHNVTHPTGNVPSF